MLAQGAGLRRAVPAVHCRKIPAWKKPITGAGRRVHGYVGSFGVVSLKTFVRQPTVSEVIMGRPTDAELEQALAVAGRMREAGDDPNHVAKALLNLNYRVRYLQRVLGAADTYLRYGQEAALHSELLRAVEEAKRAEGEPAEADDKADGNLI